MSLVLASASPRRKELLAAAGLACVVDPVNVDERRHEGEPPEGYALRMAREKASAGAARHPGAIVIGADTIVVIGSAVLGKPQDDEDARRMLRRLSGREHHVLTAVAVTRDGRLESGVERTTVWFRALSLADIDWYVGTGEPRDKAGAYAIQGGASRFIPRIEGSYSNVVGLPVAAVVDMIAVVASHAIRPYSDL